MDDEIERLKSEIKENKKRHKIELVFAKNKVRSLKAAMSMFNTDVLEEDENGELSNLDDCALAFIDENKWLFEQESKSLSTAIPHGSSVIKSPGKMSDEEYYRTVLNI